jgi:RNA polymerase sigma factor (sigma-70 family)
MIYSVILRYRFQEDDAADIFQAVCIDLFRELPALRESDALRGWLIRVTANKCFHWKRKLSRVSQEELDESVKATQPLPPESIAEVERNQLIREAVGRLQPRCREMLTMLFFEDPPRPYLDVARELGLATGSIGFIRGRCLKKLESELTGLGL